MGYYRSKIAELLFSWKFIFFWVLMAVLFFFFGFQLKESLVHEGIRSGIPYNYWDISLQFLTDPYLILYFILPISLGWSLRITTVAFDYPILMRWGSFKKWIIHSLKLYWVFFGILLGLWLFISAYLFIGLPLEISWSAFSKSLLSINDLRDVVVWFSYPFEALIFQILLLVMSLSLLHLGIAILRVLVKKNLIMLLVGVGIFLWGLIGFKLLPPYLDGLSPIIYLALPQGIPSFHNAWTVFVIVGLLLGGVFAYLQVIDRSTRVFTYFNSHYLAIGLYIGLGILSIIGNLRGLNPKVDSIWKLWSHAFWGTNFFQFSYRLFFGSAVLVMGFIYLIQLSLVNEFNALWLYKIIRHRRISHWFLQLYRKISLQILGFLFGWFAFSVVLVYVLHFQMTFPDSTSTYLYHYFVNGYLQLLFYTLVLFAVFWNSQQIVNQGILVISIFLLFALPGINIIRIIPVWLSNMSNLEVMSPLTSSLVLMFADVLLIGFIFYRFRHSIKN